MLYSYKTYIVINICEVSEKNIVELGFSLSDFATDVGVHFLSATALNENSVFTTFDYSSDRYLYGKVFKISGSTITKGVDTQLSTANFSASLERDCSILRIDESTVNVFHNYNSSQYLYSLLCTISETTITKKNDVQLSSVPKSGLYITAMASWNYYRLFNNKISKNNNIINRTNKRSSNNLRTSRRNGKCKETRCIKERND